MALRSILQSLSLVTKRSLATKRRFSHSRAKQPTNGKWCVLDLRQEGLSVIERLCLEECILRHDPLRQWIIWGTHEPMQSRYLQIPKLPEYIINNTRQDNKGQDDCIVVMGIGGKPHLLLDLDKVREDGVWVIKRFSGGGTVVVDRNCLYTTIIGRTNQLHNVQPYPREIMAWTASDVFGPTFCKLKQKALQNNDNNLTTFPDFELRENDYVLGADQKVAGNAQSIVSSGFLHHTTFLWSYRQENMEYLTLPAKRPEYRKDRAHSSFLVQLKDAYHDQVKMNDFFDCLEEVCHESLGDGDDVQVLSLEEALSIVTNVVGEGGIQAFFETKSRNRLVDLSV